MTGDVNQVAEQLHLDIAEDCFEDNKIAAARAELKLSEQLGRGVAEEKADRLRREKLKALLKNR